MYLMIYVSPDFMKHSYFNGPVSVVLMSLIVVEFIIKSPRRLLYQVPVHELGKSHPSTEIKYNYIVMYMYIM